MKEFCVLCSSKYEAKTFSKEVCKSKVTEREREREREWKTNLPKRLSTEQKEREIFC